MNKLLLFHSFNNTKNADPFYDFSISAYKKLLLKLKDFLKSDQIIISFDDGYKSILPAVDYAHKLGFKTNVNIVTSKINMPGFLSDRDIKMLFSKRTLIGSHSHTHKDLSNIPDYLLEEELTISKNLLEEIIKVPIEYLSLPYGSFTNNTLSMASQHFKKILISRPLIFEDNRLEVGLKAEHRSKQRHRLSSKLDCRVRPSRVDSGCTPEVGLLKVWEERLEELGHHHRFHSTACTAVSCR